MAERKSWMCTLCHRSGDELTMDDAQLRHRNMLHATRHHNEVMRAEHGASWHGPSSKCAGRIVMSQKVVRKRKRIRSEVFGERDGDPWVEVGSKLRVSGKVIEKKELEMAKPKIVNHEGRDEGVVLGARRLPVDVMDSDLHSFEREKVARLLEEALELKARLDEKVPDEMYDPKWHYARRWVEVREELAEIQAAEGMEDGLRYNNILFTTTLAAGRRTLDKKLLVENLLASGMKAERVMKVVEDSMKEGDETWRKSVKLLE